MNFFGINQVPCNRAAELMYPQDKTVKVYYSSTESKLLVLVFNNIYKYIKAFMGPNLRYQQIQSLVRILFLACRWRPSSLVREQALASVFLMTLISSRRLYPHDLI